MWVRWLGWPAHIFYAISCDEFLDNPCPMKCALSSWKMYISCWKVTGNDRSEISVQNLNAFLSTFDKVTTSLKKTDTPIPSYCICTYFVLEPSVVISFACFFPRYNHIYFSPTYIWQSSFKITLLHWKITAGSSPTFLPTPQ